eukprot:m51a1_g10011 hypothetical protein (632) ;mRNA; f:12287-15029
MSDPPYGGLADPFFADPLAAGAPLLLEDGGAGGSDGGSGSGGGSGGGVEAQFPSVLLLGVDDAAAAAALQPPVLLVDDVQPPPSVVASTPESPAVARCWRCRARLVEMQESSAALCQGAAQRWEQNWSAPYAPACFGACTCREFCAEHGYPHSICCAMHPQSTRHAMIVYKGAWYATRAPATAMAVDSGDDNDNDDDGAQRQRTAVVALNAPAGAVEPTAPPQPPEPPEAAQPRGAPGRCEECLRRLQRLGAVEWLKTAEQGARVAQALREAEAVCQLFCQTPYICKIHVYPTDTRRDGPPRFRCPVPHDAAKIGGRHQEWFGFYCGKAECCNGKWFSREETHRRSRKPRVAKQVPQHALPDIPQTAPAPVALTNAEKEMQNELDSPDSSALVVNSARHRGHRGDGAGGSDEEGGVELQALPSVAVQGGSPSPSAASASSEKTAATTTLSAESSACLTDILLDGKDVTGNVAFALARKRLQAMRLQMALLLALLLLVVAGLSCVVGLMAVGGRPGDHEVWACLGRWALNDTAEGYQDQCSRCLAYGRQYECFWNGYHVFAQLDTGGDLQSFVLYHYGVVMASSGPELLPVSRGLPISFSGESDQKLWFGPMAWHLSFFERRALSPLSAWMA